MEVSPIKNNVKYSDENHQLFLLKLATQAGTYVKEFVHGDFDRTVPNLANILGCDVDIIALDVEEIVLDWPPKIEPKLDPKMEPKLDPKMDPELDQTIVSHSNGVGQ